jgi:hypothetical protein
VKYVEGILTRRYKGNELFVSIIHAMVLQNDKQARGVRMQNFTYAPNLFEFAHIVQTHSPKAYDFLKEHLLLPDPWTIKYVSLLALFEKYFDEGSWSGYRELANLTFQLVFRSKPFSLWKTVSSYWTMMVLLL